ncbi:catechol 2,3-dioxygenase-like lactoylglutathione lyase family enzyme [Inquilinus ginsengisoli]|uniref:Catechol 2,3-dioxygenase-like lactoylglutathione lyase family enzyme n=1 Tax=Inquilinus ginsengisoli TaxID=363840 RepID=A0ABU1K1C9_9PROT|nr:VOC family protein [Inquilinus ginsengisoli]MDR6294312.1 catechol 2,3-dioxygenase-like lactoylglutathione lyase family enzyme [Inquilinus ginsengisoli]
MSKTPFGSAPNLAGLDHFAINIRDLQVSSNWYSDIMGFEVLHKWTTTWMIGRGNIKIGLFLRKTANPIPNPDELLLIQHVAFLVDGDKFGHTVEYLRSKGVTVEGPEDTGIAFSAFFKDPDGHSLEVTTYHA